MENELKFKNRRIVDMGRSWHATLTCQEQNTELCMLVVTKHQKSMDSSADLLEIKLNFSTLKEQVKNDYIGGKLKKIYKATI